MGRGAIETNDAIDGVSQLHEVSAFVALPADDARSGHHGAGAFRPPAGLVSETVRDIRSRAAVFLSAASAVDSRVGRGNRLSQIRVLAASAPILLCAPHCAHPGGLWA